MRYFGIDVSDKSSRICEIDEEGQIVDETMISTAEKAFTRWFADRERARICVEAGTSSPWIDRLLKQLGHEVIVANPRRVKLIAESSLKTDRIDAEILARLVRMDPEFLHPVTHRSLETQQKRSDLRVRSGLIKTRTALINCVRGMVKGFGYRLPRMSTGRFEERVLEVVPASLKETIRPLLKVLSEINLQIKAMDQKLKRMVEENEACKRLQEIPGVGPVIAVSYQLCLDDPKRFKSRAVGPYLGLTPQLRESGEMRRSGHITRCGDKELRALLTQAAHCVLRGKQNSDLKCWGEGLVKKIGKRKAIVAIARKLSIIMHRVWVSGESYDPLYHSRMQQKMERAVA